MPRRTPLIFDLTKGNASPHRTHSLGLLRGIVIAASISRPVFAPRADRSWRCDMPPETDASLRNGYHRLRRPAAAIGLTGHAEPLLGRLARASEPDDQRVSRPLRIGFVILVLFEMVYLLEVGLFESGHLTTASYFSAFDIALASMAFGATYLHWFKRHWRAFTMGVFQSVIVSRTLMGIALDQDEPVLVALFAIVVITAMFVPWNLRWHLGLMAASMVSFSGISLIGAIDTERCPALAHTLGDHGALVESYLAQKILSDRSASRGRAAQGHRGESRRDDDRASTRWCLPRCQR
jgi:hypothetical protein